MSVIDLNVTIQSLDSYETLHIIQAEKPMNCVLISLKFNESAKLLHLGKH